MNCRPVYLGPPNFILEDRPACAKCSCEVDSSTMDKYQDVYETVDSLLDPEDEADVTQRDVSRCLELMSGLFHPCHRLMVRAAEFAFEDAAVARGDLKVAAEYGRACVQAYR